MSDTPAPVDPRPPGYGTLPNYPDGTAAPTDTPDPVDLNGPGTPAPTDPPVFPSPPNPSGPGTPAPIDPKPVDYGSLPNLPDGTPAPTDSPGPSGDVYAQILSLLQRYGLESLADWAWEQIVNESTPEEIIQSLRDREEYRTRFKAIFDREAAGLSPISAEQVLQYESQARQIMRAYGLPSGFWDSTDDIQGFIARDWSVAEIEQALQVYVEATEDTPPEYRAALERMYGIGTGGVAAYLMDPDKAAQALQRQWRAAQVGGEASRQGFGDLTVAEAEGLADAGLDRDAAAQGFGELGRSRELWGALDEGEGQVSRETLLGAVAGDQASVEEMERRARRRVAQFSGGGAFAAGQTGLGGVGRSS